MLFLRSETVQWMLKNTLICLSAVSPRCPASSVSPLSGLLGSSWLPAGPPEAPPWSSPWGCHSHLLPCSWHLWWRKEHGFIWAMCASTVARLECAEPSSDGSVRGVAAWKEMAGKVELPVAAQWEETHHPVDLQWHGLSLSFSSSFT